MLLEKGALIGGHQIGMGYRNRDVVKLLLNYSIGENIC